MAAAKQHLDFISIMTYDYHGGGWEPFKVNFHAPWQDVLVSGWLGERRQPALQAAFALAGGHAPALDRSGDWRSCSLH